MIRAALRLLPRPVPVCEIATVYAAGPSRTRVYRHTTGLRWLGTTWVVARCR